MLQDLWGREEEQEQDLHPSPAWREALWGGGGHVGEVQHEGLPQAHHRHTLVAGHHHTTTTTITVARHHTTSTTVGTVAGHRPTSTTTPWRWRWYRVGVPACLQAGWKLHHCSPWGRLRKRTGLSGSKPLLFIKLLKSVFGKVMETQF